MGWPLSTADRQPILLLREYILREKYVFSLALGWQILLFSTCSNNWCVVVQIKKSWTSLSSWRVVLYCTAENKIASGEYRSFFVECLMSGLSQKIFHVKALIAETVSLLLRAIESGCRKIQEVTMKRIERFIAREVREKVFLYDPHHIFYRSPRRREEAWTAISIALLRNFPILEGLNNRKLILFFWIMND